MSIVKISELPAATSPVSPSDVAAVVQNGVTKKAAIDQLGFIAAGAGASPRTIQDKLREGINVDDFGAVGDGVIDDTMAIQAAVNAAVSQGRPLYFGGASKIYRTTSTITIPASPYSGDLTSARGLGTYIEIYGNGSTISNTTTTVMQAAGLGGLSRVSQLRFVGGIGGTATVNPGIGLSFSSSFAGLLIEECSFTNFDIGLQIDGSNQVVVDNCRFITNKTRGCALLNVASASSNVSEIKNCIFWGKTTSANAYDLSDTLLYISRSLNCRIVRNTFEWPQRYGIRASRLDATVIESNYFEHGGVPGVSGTYDIWLESSPLYANSNNRICQNLHSGSGGGGQGGVPGAHYPIGIRDDWNMFMFGNIITGFDSANINARYADGTFSAETSIQRFNDINIVPRNAYTGINAEDYRFRLDQSTVDSEGTYVFERRKTFEDSATTDAFEIEFGGSFNGAIELTLSHGRGGSNPGSSAGVSVSYGYIGSNSLTAVPTFTEALTSTTLIGTPLTWSTSIVSNKIVFSVVNGTGNDQFGIYSVKLYTATPAIGLRCKITAL